MDTDRVDRYVIAAWVIRFWWIAAGFGAVAGLWLFRSIVSSIA